MAAKTIKNQEEAKPVLIQGNQAIAEGAIAAGCRFFAGYPITPATEIAEAMATELPKIGGTFIQMEDEIASMGAITGASLAGVKSMTATSGPGFSLKQEAIGFACMAEVPTVVVNVMRAGPSTGIATAPSQSDVMQARWGTHGDHPIIVLAVANVEECFRYTITAFNFSEKYRTPVIILSDEIVSHTREVFTIPNKSEYTVFNRVKPKMPPEWYKPYEDNSSGVPPMSPFGEGYRYHVTGLTHDAYGFPTSKPNEVISFNERIFRKINRAKQNIQIVKEYMMDDADISIIVYGSITRSAISAARMAREIGIKVGVLQLVTLFPFPEKEVIEVLRKSKFTFVPEMNFGQIAGEVDRVNKNYTTLKKVNRYDGNVITPTEILNAIRRS